MNKTALISALVSTDQLSKYKYSKMRSQST